MRDLEKSKKIHREAVESAESMLKDETWVLRTLINVEEDRTYELFGMTYLTTYCVKMLHIRKEIAKTFVRVVRKSREVPELAQAVLDGEVDLPKARVISSVITDENKREWLDKAKHLTKEKLERLIATQKGQTTKRTTLDLKFETIELLTRAQELLCSKTQTYATLEDTIHAMAKEYVHNHDPVEKANRSRGSSLKHEITKRDQERCQYIYEDGSQCEERKWLDRHHRTPRSLGGADSLENMITVCAGHHRLIHRREPKSRNRAPMPRSLTATATVKASQVCDLTQANFRRSWPGI